VPPLLLELLEPPPELLLELLEVEPAPLLLELLELPPLLLELELLELTLPPELLLEPPDAVGAPELLLALPAGEPPELLLELLLALPAEEPPELLDPLIAEPPEALGVPWAEPPELLLLPWSPLAAGSPFAAGPASSSPNPRAPSGAAMHAVDTDTIAISKYRPALRRVPWTERGTPQPATSFRIPFEEVPKPRRRQARAHGNASSKRTPSSAVVGPTSSLVSSWITKRCHFAMRVAPSHGAIRTRPPRVSKFNANPRSDGSVPASSAGGAWERRAEEVVTIADRRGRFPPG
jgi:hypothetical protein